MNYWYVLNHGVTTTLQSGRVGQPVFVRCTAAVAESTDAIRDHLAEMVAAVNGWFSNTPDRVYAQGAENQGLCTVTLAYPTGATAILSVVLEHHDPQLDLIVLGSRGAIYHNESIRPLRDGSLTPQPVAEVAAIMQAIAASLASGEPALVEQEVAS